LQLSSKILLSKGAEKKSNLVCHQKNQCVPDPNYKSTPQTSFLATDEEQNWILILIAIAIVAVGIAAVLSRKKKTTTTKGSTIKKIFEKS